MSILWAHDFGSLSVSVHCFPDVCSICVVTVFPSSAAGATPCSYKAICSATGVLSVAS